jgi:uncharacterized membrane protein (DUF2068 family)
MSERNERSGVVVAIGIFKLLKGTLLVAAGLGALHFLHRDASQMAEDLLERVPVAPGRTLIERLVARVAALDEKQLAEIAFGTFTYAAIFAVEGVGLLLGKVWAEWLTIIVTASFIPLEIWHAVHHSTATSFATIAVNVAIVIYLAARLRRRKRSPDAGHS